MDAMLLAPFDPKLFDAKFKDVSDVLDTMQSESRAAPCEPNTLLFNFKITSVSFSTGGYRCYAFMPR